MQNSLKAISEMRNYLLEFDIEGKIKTNAEKQIIFIQWSLYCLFCSLSDNSVRQPANPQPPL